MNWYIGQEVVALKNAMRLKQGVIYVISGLKTCPCLCGGVLLNVGISACDTGGSGAYQEACKCGWRGPVNSDPTMWYKEKLFAPLMDISELKEILNEETINK